MDDRAAIREVVDNWALWRDGGDFDRLLTCWHEGGRMVTTWGRFDAPGFVAAARAAWNGGSDAVHVLGGITIDLVDDRAIAQTRMTIQLRADLDGQPVDVTCIGRFFDLFERRDGCWAMRLRQPIYDRDRLDPVVPGAVVTLDAGLLQRFPPGYRHLAYVQTRLGMEVARDLPQGRGEAVDKLKASGVRWLAGQDHE